MKIIVFLSFFIFKIDCSKFVNSKSILRKSNIFDFNIACSANCYPPYPNLPLLFNAYCGLKKFCDSKYELTWKVTPEVPKFSYKKTNLINNKDFNRTLTVAPNIFRPGDRIYFSATLEGITESLLLVFFKEGCTFDIECVENCPIADIKKNTIHKVASQPNCLDSYFGWTLDPSTDLTKYVTYGANNETITILPGAYKEKAVVMVRLEGILDKSAKITFQSFDTKLNIYCEANCKEINVMKLTRLKAECIERCPQNSLYIWKFDPIISTTFLSFSGKNNEIATISPYALKDFESVDVKVTLGKNGTQTYLLTIAQMERDCNIRPLEGVSGMTEFRITCTYDDIFTVYQNYENGSNNLLYKGEMLNNVDLLLSEGNPAKITVISQYFKETHPLSVAVRAPTENDTKQYLKVEILKKLPELIDNNKLAEAANRAPKLAELLSGLSDGNFQDHYAAHIADIVMEHISDFDSDFFLRLLAILLKMKDVIGTFGIHMFAEIFFKAIQRFYNHQRKFTDSHIEHTVETSVKLASILANKTDKLEESLEVFGETHDLDYPLYDDMYYSRASALFHHKYISYYLISALQLIGNLKYSNNLPLKQTSIEEGMITSTQVIRSDSTITVDGINSFVNISNSLKSEMNVGSYLSMQIALLNPNPLWWDSQGKDIKSEVILANIFFNEEKVESLTNFLDLFLYTEEISLEKKPIRGKLTEEVSLIYKVKVISKMSVEITIKHIDDDYFVLISKRFPTINEIKKNGYLVSSMVTVHKTLYNINNSVYVGIARWLGHQPTFEIVVSAKKCLSWTETERFWTSRHCRVGTRLKRNYTHCQCNHLSVFAATYFVPPNKLISLSTMTIHEQLSQSSVVITFLILILSFWGLLMIKAHHTDLHYYKHVDFVHKLPDNTTGYRSLYVVCVESGVWMSTCTTANVVLELIGEKERSHRHVINAVGHLTNGGEIWFAIYTSKHLGRIIQVRIFHDSDGNSPDWFCERITIQHPETNEIYVFLVRNWLSPLFGDGKTDRIIESHQMSLIQSGAIMLPFVLRSEFKEKHLWFSVFSRPGTSTFSAKERITLAFTLVLLSMLTSAMFYGIDTSMDSVGTFTIAIREFSIIVQTLVITVPAGFAIAFIFKFSRPYK